MSDELKEMFKSNPDKMPERTEFMKFKGTGKHTLKFTGMEKGNNNDYQTGQEVEGYFLVFDEDGVSKKYFTPIIDKNTGKYHYLILKFRDIEIGDELEMEYTPIKGTPKGYINVEVLNRDIDVAEDPDGDVIPDPEFE